MPPVTVGIVGGTGRVYAGPTLVAFGRGYFRDEGLDVELVESGGAPRAIPMIAKSELDVTAQGPSLLFFRAWDPAAPMRMVADHGSLREGRGTGAIVARPELIEQGALKDYSDLRGKKLGLSSMRGHHDWVTFAIALRLGGLTFDDVEVVTTDFGDGRHEAVANGTVDLTTVGRPSSIAEGRETGAFVVWKYNYEIRPGHVARAVVFSPRFHAERSDEGSRYVRAYLRGARDYYGAFERGVNRDEVVRVLAAEAHTSEAIVNEMIPIGLNPDGYIDADSVSQDLQWFHDEGLLTQPVPIEEVVVSTYVDDALAQLGPYEGS